MLERMSRPPPERYEKAQPVLAIDIKKNGLPESLDDITGPVSAFMLRIEEVDGVCRIIINLNGDGDIFYGTKKELYQIEDPSSFLIEKICKAIGYEHN